MATAQAEGSRLGKEEPQVLGLQGPGPASHPPCPLSSPAGSHEFSETAGRPAHSETTLTAVHLGCPPAVGVFWRSGEQTWQRGEQETPQRKHSTAQAAMWRPVMLDASCWVGAAGLALTTPRGSGAHALCSQRELQPLVKQSSRQAQSPHLL